MSKALKLLDDMINELTLLVEEPNIVVAPKTHSAPADNESNVNKELNVNKKEKKVATPTTNTSEPVDTVININSIDLRVGIIRKVTKHETAGIHITHVLTVYYTILIRFICIQISYIVKRLISVKKSLGRSPQASLSIVHLNKCRIELLLLSLTLSLEL